MGLSSGSTTASTAARGDDRVFRVFQGLGLEVLGFRRRFGEKMSGFEVEDLGRNVLGELFEILGKQV